MCLWIPSLKESLKELGLCKENFRGLTEFRTEGSICHVGMRFQERGKKEVVVEIEMEKVEDHWQVISFSNLPELARAVF